MAKKIRKSESEKIGPRLYSTSFEGNDETFYTSLKDAETDTRKFCDGSEEGMRTVPVVVFVVREYELNKLTPQLAYSLLNGGKVRDSLIKSSRIWGKYVYVPSEKLFAVSRNPVDAPDKGEFRPSQLEEVEPVETTPLTDLPADAYTDDEFEKEMEAARKASEYSGK